MAASSSGNRIYSSISYPVRTLLIFLLLQTLLLTVNLKLLPMWGDEAFTVTVAAGTPEQVVAAARNDVHPPLYFLLAHWWLQIPHGGLPNGETPLAWARLLSAAFAIASTIAIDRLWLRGVSRELREWFLLFWAFSPCLLLFGRMARSYSLQVLLSVIAIWCAVEFAKDSSGWKRLAALTAAMTALIYTHYLPGLAVWAGVNVLLVKSVGRSTAPLWRRWLMPNLLIAAAYLPWMAALVGDAIPRWQHNAGFNLTGSVWTELVLKLAYWFYSFAFGEAIPLWLLAASVLLAAPCLWLLYAGLRAGKMWLIPGSVVAAVAFIGAAHFGSYPFMGARLLFLLPLFLLAVTVGIGDRGRAGTVIGMLLFAANMAGIWAYFGARDLLNVDYMIPTQRIAAAIVILSSPDDTEVWVDRINIADSVLEYYLPKGFRLRALTSAQAAAQARAELASGSIRHLWFIRNATNPVFEPLEQEMNRAWYEHSVRFFLPLSGTQKAVMEVLAKLRGQRGYRPPEYLYEVWEYHRPGPA